MSVLVYRLVNLDGDLLYVGCTTNLNNRLDRHRAVQPWWSEVGGAIVSIYATLAEGRAAESHAIGHESPRHNRQGVLDDDHSLTEAAVAAMRHERAEADRRALLLAEHGLAERERPSYPTPIDL